MRMLNHKKGVILIFVLLILVALIGIALAFWYTIISDMRTMGAGLAGMKAFYVAEAGRAKARWALTKGGQSVGWGETSSPFGTGKGTYIVTTAYYGPQADQRVTITSTGYFPDNTKPIAQRQVVENNISLAGGGGGANLSIGATSSASSNIDKAPNINDADVNSQWKAKDDNVWEWVKLDFKSEKQFSKVVVNGDKIDQRVIEYSTDNNTWLPVASLVENPPWTFTFTSVSARYLRLKVYGDKKPEINELETYGGGSLGQGKFGTSL